MRIAVLSDVHGNLPALEAVLEQIKPYDAVWQLGDVVGYGPQPGRGGCPPSPPRMQLAFVATTTPPRSVSWIRILFNDDAKRRDRVDDGAHHRETRHG